MSLADDYYSGLRAALAGGPPPELDAAALLHEAATAGRSVFTFGNGACASLAAHMPARKTSRPPRPPAARSRGRT